MTLVVELERELPRRLPERTATAIFCLGTCFDTQLRIENLEILVDRVAHPVTAFGMPRPDRIAADPGVSAPSRLYSGFWTTVPIAAASAPGSTIQLEVLARLSDGTSRAAELGAIEVVADQTPLTAAAEPARPGPETIAICMATYEPDVNLLEVQIESLRAQTDERWICLVSDDCSSPERFARILRLIGEDRRFAVSRSDQRLGFYRNFERALAMVPTTADLVALCDQDDRWHPDKLADLRSALGDAILAYSDQRLVQADGTVLRDTFWVGRSNNYDSIVSVLVANTITGAATLFRRELLELALPFPDTPGMQFHDSWLAITALAAGRVVYVDRPLYDYVQHPGAVFGDVTHGPRSARAARLTEWPERLRPSALASTWRAAYFYGYVPRAVQARTVLARRGPSLPGSRRRLLERFLACEHSVLALAWLALRPLRALLGHTETLGSELGLVQGLLWRRLASAGARHPRLLRGALADAGVPPPQRFSQKRLRRWRSRI